LFSEQYKKKFTRKIKTVFSQQEQKMFAYLSSFVYDPSPASKKVDEDGKVTVGQQQQEQEQLETREDVVDADMCELKGPLSSVSDVGENMFPTTTTTTTQSFSSASVTGSKLITAPPTTFPALTILERMVHWIDHGQKGLSSIVLFTNMARMQVHSAHYQEVVDQKILDWIQRHDKGTCFERTSAPTDVDDFSRCYAILELIPEWKEHINTTMASVSPHWKTLTKHWNQLTNLYLHEILKEWDFQQNWARFDTIIRYCDLKHFEGFENGKKVSGVV